MPRLLNNWLRSYSELTSVSEAPDVFNFWTGVSTIAGALQRKVWFEQIKWKWFPNFYIIFVAPPGIATKSSTMAVGMKLLRDVDGVIMGPSSMTWQGLTSGMQKAQRLLPIGDQSDFLNAQYYTQSAITCEVSELGTFLDPRNTELSSVLIDLWDGKEIPFERWLATKDDTKIDNPWINIIAATTPSWLRENAPETMIGGGLTSRVIFVYADKKKRTVAYLDDEIELDDYREKETALIHDLNEINKLYGAISLTREAREFGRSWYENLWQRPEEHLTDQQFEGYRARKQTHVHKLAMVLSVANNDSMEIDKQTLDLAIKLMAGVEYDMHKVFESIGINLTSKHVNTILTYLRIYEKMTRTELWRYCIKSMSPREFGEATDACVQAGYLHLNPSNNEIYYMLLFAGKNTTHMKPPTSDSGASEPPTGTGA